MGFLTDEVIDTRALSVAAMRSGDGACVVFEGVVRDHNHGHAVDWIEYEAYRPMAEKEIAAVLERVTRQHPSVSVSLQHRLGKLLVGEASIVIACAAPHRAQAFDACRSVIDLIKERVPIWKKEHGPDGEEWIGWQK